MRNRAYIGYPPSRPFRRTHLPVIGTQELKRPCALAAERPSMMVILATETPLLLAPTCLAAPGVGQLTTYRARSLSRSTSQKVNIEYQYRNRRLDRAKIGF